MAQLLLIKEASLTAADNRQIGDIVGIFDDNHVFTNREKELFNIVKVESSREVLDTENLLVQPQTREAWRSTTTNWSIEEPQKTIVWQDGNDWKEIKDAPRFPTRYDRGAVAENYSRENANHTVLIADVVGLDG